MEWKGIFPALTTPFTTNDELDLPMFEKNLHAQINAGVHGVIIGGSLGEASTLNNNEKEELIKFALKKVGEDTGDIKYCRGVCKRCVATNCFGKTLECRRLNVASADALQS